MSKFAKMILDEAGLDKNGDPIPDREPPKRKPKAEANEEDSEGENMSPKKRKLLKKLAM